MSKDPNKITQNGYFSEEVLRFDANVLICCSVHRQRKILDYDSKKITSYTASYANELKVWSNPNK